MNVSPVANDLVEAINNYIEESSRTSYRFTLEEQLELQNKIAILNNQIDMLIKYELEKREK